jgi:hypothetical protein
MDRTGSDAHCSVHGRFRLQQSFHPWRDDAVIDPAKRRDQRPSRLGREAADDEHIAHPFALTPLESQDRERKYFTSLAALQF